MTMASLARPNVLVFCTDQQRADSLGVMGNTIPCTPNLDTLAGRGTLYRRHYSVSPICMPSRASFLTGCYPQATGVLANGQALRQDLPTMPAVFQAADYRTASFGKLHLQPYMHYPGSPSMEDMQRWNAGELDGWEGPYYGFQKVAITTGHGSGPNGGHYGRWRSTHYPHVPADADPNYPSIPEHACFVSRLPVNLHASTWITDHAMEVLDSCAVAGDSFYLNVSYPDPHHPFVPPLPWATMFDGRPFPAPHRVEGENLTKPGPWKQAMTASPFPKGGAARFFPELTDRDIDLIRARTAAMIALIDHNIGRILRRLDARGLTENTIIVFTSDHGDFLGDHFLLYKGEIPARPLLHLPLIVVDPAAGPAVVDDVCSNVDLMPTLLQRCGMDIPATVQGVPLPAPGKPASRDYAYETAISHASPNWLHHSLYTRDWKIAYWPRLRDGELYDLRADPFEHRNLFADPAHRQVRSDLLEKLFAATGAAEPADHAIPVLW
jgi:arylsulfatase A-like enzyme